MAGSHDDASAMQIIVLGGAGGPIDDDTTAMLVRSTSEEWRKGSVLAVDAGVHLASIIKILEPHLPSTETRKTGEAATVESGPFKGLSLPHVSVKANAAHIIRTLVDTFVITHPHLDHMSGMVVNTAALPGMKPKRIAALPATISAFKNHVFNNVIWPNLSDEDNGAGLVTYMRLIEGGSPMIGSHEARGYVEVAEGLAVKSWSVSHGHCMKPHHHSHRASVSSMNGHYPTTGSEQFDRTYSTDRYAPSSPQPYFETPPRLVPCVYDSSAHFIRDVKTGKEVLIFGDVEPDSLSLAPRNALVWADAAPKIANGSLKAIFIECSYDDSQSDDSLYGHLAPRFLIEELNALADQVLAFRTHGRVRPGSGPYPVPVSPYGYSNNYPSSRVGTPARMSSVPNSPGCADNHRRRKRVSLPQPVNPAMGAAGGMGIGSPNAGSHNSISYFETPGLSHTHPDHNGIHMRPSARSEPRHHPASGGLKHKREESSVSPHSRPLQAPHPSLGPMQIDVFELDEHGPLRAARRNAARRVPTGGRNRSRSGSANYPTELRTQREECTSAPRVADSTAVSPTNTKATHGQPGPSLAVPSTSSNLAATPALTPEQGDASRPRHDHDGTRDSGNGTTIYVKQSAIVDQLKGLIVVIIHVKDKLNDDEPAADVILRQLREYEEQERLGVEFVVARQGMSIFV